MEEELFRNKIYVSSPTSISIGNCTWRCLDTKLVGRVKALIEENENRKEIINQTKEDLQNTKRLNEHFEDKYGNEFVNFDIDHIDYLINILECEVKNAKSNN